LSMAVYAATFVNDTARAMRSDAAMFVARATQFDR